MSPAGTLEGVGYVPAAGFVSGLWGGRPGAVLWMVLCGRLVRMGMIDGHVETPKCSELHCFVGLGQGMTREGPFVVT